MSTYRITGNLRKQKFTKIALSRTFRKKKFENKWQHAYVLTTREFLQLLPVMDMFVFESVVRGNHIYKEIWSSMLGEELQCFHEIGNIHDLYAVKVSKTGTGTVGHLPKKISMPCHLFLEKEEVLGAQSLGDASTPLTCSGRS